jgi:hypothetical protein
VSTSSDGAKAEKLLGDVPWAATVDPDTASSARRERQAIDGLRIIAAALLALHYFTLMKYAPDVLRVLGPPLPSAQDATLLARLVAAGGLFELASERWFALGVVFSLLVGIGIRPRLCAALSLPIAATTYAMLRPAAVLDDYFAAAVSFWLILLPVGSTLAILRFPSRHAAQAGPLDSVPPRAFLAFLWLALFAISLHKDAALAWYRFGFVASAAGLALPLRRWRAVGLLPGLVCLWPVTLFEGTWLACGTIIAACIAVSVVDWNGARFSDGASGRIGFEAVFGCGTVTLLVIHLGATVGGAARIGDASNTLLGDIGLAGLPDAVLAVQRTHMDLAFVPPDQSAFAASEHFVPGNARLQGAIRLLNGIRYAATPESVMLVKRAAAQYCYTNESVGIMSRRIMTVIEDGRASNPLAVVECGGAGAAPKIRVASDRDLRP